MKYAELPSFLAEAPLYQPKPLEDVTFGERGPEATSEGLPRKRETGFPAPKELSRRCVSPKCAKVTNWSWSGIPGSAEYIRPGLNLLTYECRNCGEHTFSVWVRFSGDRMRRHIYAEKIGQYPKLGITLPPEFEKALGAAKDLYIRGITSRHAGYGIGALGYFRRVIDDTIHDMLSVLEAAMAETGAAAEALETVRAARAGKVFDEKVKLAAEVIPAHLKPGGINPFADLYDLYSIGLHKLSDEECCDIVDAMDEAMK